MLEGLWVAREAGDLLGSPFITVAVVVHQFRESRRPGGSPASLHRSTAASVWAGAQQHAARRARSAGKM